MIVGNVGSSDTMKRQILITLVGTLLLISLAQFGILTTTTAAADQQQKCQLKAESGNERDVTPSLTTTGAQIAGGNNHISLLKEDPALSPSEIVLQTNIPDSVHCGDAIVATGKLINKNTGEGIPGAVLTGAASVDGNNWITVGSVKTDGTGTVSYPLTVPDPRAFGYALPLKVYCKISYCGCASIAPTSQIFSVTLLPPQ